MRALKLTAALGAAIVLLGLLAAWQLPARLDWNRYRATIAAFASARMGRQVTIGGQVRLLLLPDAVLVAEKVRLADRGDGVSATIGALRLRISIGALLQGHVVPRRLELDDPVVKLPWPLPRGAAQAVPTGLAGGFTASVEGGSLHLGGVTLAGINAGVQTDPDTGAFAAQGAARFGNLPSRFTALIGAPDPAGVSLLTVTVDGQDSAQGAGGTLRGRVRAGGAVQGDLALRGPDLSRLLPAPALPWRLRGAVSADEAQVQAPALALMLGDSPGDGSATLHLGPAPSLDLSARLGQVPLGAWALAAASPSPALKLHLDVSATASALMGGTLRNGHAVLSLDAGSASVQAQGVLPGGAAVKLDGASHPAQGDPQFSGTFTLSTQDAPALADWLAPVAPAVFAVLPPLPPQMDMKGSLRLHGATAAFTDLSGHIGAGAVTGSLALIQGERPSVTATLATDRLDIASSPAWPGWWAASQNLAALAAPFAGFDATFDITAASLTLGDRALARVALQGQGTAEALTVTRLQADLPGAHVEASGTVAQDGTVADARLDLAAADAGALKLPVKLPAGLWKGPLHIALTAAGPPQAVTGQLRGDLGDLRAEAEAHFNAQAPLLAATVTLRHPGAPRLLEQAGLSDAGAWVGQGSLAFLAHLTAAPGQIVANDVSLAAGTLRLGGQLGIDLAGADPVISGRLDAPMLTLPALAIPMDASPPLWLLQGWQGQIVISAGQILSGLNNLAANAGATLTVAFGGALLDGIALDIAGGHFTGQAAIDAAAALPQLTMRGTLAKALTGDLPALPGLTWQDGTVDLQADLAAAGHTPGTWLATLTGGGHAALTGAALQGIDLPTLTRLLTTHAAHLRTALPAALATGQTGPLSGDITATLDNGALTMSAATLTGPSGSLILSGSIDLPGHAPDLLLRALPAVPQPPDLAVRIVDGRRVTNAQPGLVWAGKNK